MFVKNLSSVSCRLVLTAFPLLISTLFGNIVLGSGSDRTTSEYKKSGGSGSQEKYYRPVPLLKYHSSAEYNPFDSVDMLRYPNDRKRPSSASNEFYSQKFLATKPLPFDVTKGNDAPGHSKSTPDTDCILDKKCLENHFLHKLGSTSYEELITTSPYGTSAIPFTVKAEKNADGLSLFPTSTRRTRTTTPVADENWVKLQAINPPRSYDPFGPTRTGNLSEEANSTTLFASRSGMELSPETFAERHGWKDGKYTGPSGMKHPPWVDELNYQHGGYGGSNRRQGYGPDRPHDHDRDDGNRWVKLEAIPVAGVKISKWVPKNTAPSELPSTSWKYPSKPSWWDRMDGGPGNSFPHHHGHGHNSHPSMYHQQHQPSWPTRYPNYPHHQTDSWNDVIYPNNNPVSATASWASDSKASSSSSMPMSLGWPKNPHPGTRYPLASWSATENNRPSSSYNGGSPPFQRPQNGKPPPYYPDPDEKDEQQWVLISSTKNSHGSGNSQVQNSPYSEFPFPFINNRHSKLINLTKLDKFGTASGPVVPNKPVMTQDELFRRTNETLFSLKPVLGNKRGSQTTESPLSQTILDMLTSTAANIVESTTMKYNNIGFSRSSTTAKRSVTDAPNRKKRVMPEISPVVASVGAGMLPSTFGSIIPLVFGRKKREIAKNLNRHKFNKNRSRVYQYYLVTPNFKK